MGGGARHPPGPDRGPGQLLRPRRHIAVRSATGDRARSCAVLQGHRRSPDSRRSGEADGSTGGGRSGFRARPNRPVRDHAMTTSSPTSVLNVDGQPGKPQILLAEAARDAARWAAEHRDALRAFVAQNGALVVRGLELRDVAGIAALFRNLGGLMTETEAFAPRRRYADGVYSSSKWPSNQPMCMHHELSYALEPPSFLMFACTVAPTKDGATPVADAAAVRDALPADLVERFERVGWLLIRNYNDDIGASVADAFGTDDRRAVESYCRANAIEYEWRDGGALRTVQRRRAVVRHPVTARPSWFSQIAFLSEWTLASEVREYLVDVYGEDGLPFNTQFGNGDPIDADVVRVINEVYDANTLREPWQAGDLLLVDNIRTAHGREPFEGPRELVVALADPVRVSEAVS